MHIVTIMSSIMKKLKREEFKTLNRDVCIMTVKEIKSYGQGTLGKNYIQKSDAWRTFTFYYNEIIGFDLFVYSSQIDDELIIEKAVIAFFEKIIEKYPGKEFDKEVCEVLKIWKNPPTWMPEDFMSEGLKHWRGFTNYFELDFEISEVKLITLQSGDAIVGIDVLKEAFARFAEVYAQERGFLTI